MSIKTQNNEWEHEPNHLRWRDEHSGFICEISRHMYFGHLCGYVGVPLKHALYGMPVNDVESIFTGDVGVSYSDFKKDSELFWIGFDCASLGEIMPFYREIERFEGVDYVYRNVDYVRSHCELLARQLRIIEENQHILDKALPK